MQPNRPENERSLSVLRHVDELCDRFENALNAGHPPRIEDYLNDAPEQRRAVLLRELLSLEISYRLRRGETPNLEEYVRRFPQQRELIRSALARPSGIAEAALHEAETGSETVGEEDNVIPERFGHYRILEKLGKGSFGVVYKAWDEELRQSVALKVPHAHRIERPQDLDTYLAEARTQASVDHPNVVPIYYVGRTDDGRCYLVSKLIDGCDLAKWIKKSRLSILEAVELVRATAEALHHAHHKGLVHRDVKPANILIDSEGKPYLADFGLVLREEDFGKTERFVGTVAYMSPEQARGEGHRVDGRSDIFSLGVVLYELLTGNRPFRGETREQVLEHILSGEARPLRQIADVFPKELERICNKAMAKRASERYTTARDFAEDLRAFARDAAPTEPTNRPDPPVILSAPPSDSSVKPTPISQSVPLRIVPKGLRSFDAHDADFFLELIPGPRDREGLPDGLRFWKTRIEERDADNTFAVGLIYGPSGCGKSSLVKAGLLSRLAESVLAVYVEAMASETETRLLKALRKQFPTLPAHLGLVDTLTDLRRGRGLAEGQKLLLVLDQFEQWLHARTQEDNELVHALRQCDGGHVQAILMVRDDFWLAVSRFLGELEIEQSQGRNVALVDLFDPRHAKRVLAAFGRAFGILPERGDERTVEQEAFLDRAIEGLSQDNKIVPVRLSLFAEMVKGKSWTPAALKALGGTEGVGVTFLEETFSVSTAPPQYRVHLKAAQAVLKALLPEAGSDIKGNMRSFADLRKRSGYESRPKDFETLLHYLDGELRLITPTDPAGVDSEDNRNSTEPSARYYQLTHDYLVPSLRAWLYRKDQETLRGRMGVRLTERSALWNARKESRYLPAWWEWLGIRAFTSPAHWTADQRKMIRAATLHHGSLGAALLLGLLLLAGASWQGIGHMKAATLCERVLGAPPEKVPEIAAEMTPYRRWVDPRLQQAYAEAEAKHDEDKQLRASLALRPVDPGQSDYLRQRLLNADPAKVDAIRQMLALDAANEAAQLWASLEEQKLNENERFHIACALAALTPTDERWPKMAEEVATTLAAHNSLTISGWTRLLLDVRILLLPPLAKFLEEERWTNDQHRTLAALYATFATDNPAAFRKLEEDLSARVAKKGADLPEIKRQANLAASLLAMGETKEVWPLLVHSPDPTLRSYLIERIGPTGADANLLLDKFQHERDDSIRRALLLSLGQFGEEQIPKRERERLAPLLLSIFRDNPNPGTHSAAEWLLKKWGYKERVRTIVEDLATGKVEENRRWFVNKNLQTMLLVPNCPGLDEGRILAMSATEVTVEEFQRIKGNIRFNKDQAPNDDCPVNSVNWYEAAEFCNALNFRDGIGSDECCYLRNDKGKDAESMKHAPSFVHKRGYRLPIAVEWKFACRAETRTPWSCGDVEDDLVMKYACCIRNSYENTLSRSSPVGLMKPNDFGFFDMHGNVSEWCDELGLVTDSEPLRVERKTPKERSNNERIDHSVRGGSHFLLPREIMSNSYIDTSPIVRGSSLGFRIARVLP